MPPVIPGVRIKSTPVVLAMRIMVWTFFCLIAAGAATAMASTPRATAGGGTYLLFLVIFWLPGIAFALVIHRARLTATGDVLTYQRPLRAQAWKREEIAAFWLGKPRRRTYNVHVGMDTATGEQVPFRAIEASWLLDRDELDCWRAALADWLEAADEPSQG
jgi:hypothetical protein